jgi:hypothetical protein
MGIRIGQRVLQETSCNSCVDTSVCVFCPNPFQTYGVSGTCVYYNNGPATCGINQEQFNSRLDCRFNAENGEFIAAMIGISAALLLVSICCCIARSGACSEANCLCLPPPEASEPPRPAYTPAARAPRPVAVAIPNRPESLRVCSTLATDVVLVASAPKEEPVISAESEIIVAPPFDLSSVF